VIKTNNLKKYTGKINLTQQVFPWLKVGANTNFSFSHNNRIPGSNIGSTIMARSLEQRPFDRPYKPNGDYYVGGTEELLRHNPLQILNEEKSYLNNTRFLGNFFGEVKFLRDFSFKTSFGTDLAYTNDYVYYMKDHPYSTGDGRLLDHRRLLSNIIFENTLHYDKRISMLDLSVLAGHSYQRNSNSAIDVDGRGFPSPAFDVNSVAATIASAGTALNNSALESYFGRANLNWDNRYLLMLSMRADGSSRFAPENRFGYFPAASFGWVASREKFWTMPRLSLKLRTSYGQTGNQEGISNYAYQALAGGGYNYNGSSGIAITGFGNRDLTWETANQLDVGADIGWDRGKFNLSVDYFVKNTTNLLYSKPVYATSGFTSIISNVGSMRNAGLELDLSSNLQIGELTWNSSLNVSFIRNKLTSLIGDENLLIGANRVLSVGHEVGSFYVYKQIGIFQDDSEVPQPLYNSGVRAGDVKYEDLNKDGKIDVNDRQIVGSSNPKFFGGWNNTFRYKQFDLAVFFTYSQGSSVYAPWRITVSRLGNGLYPFLEDQALDRWTGPGTSNTVPRAIYGSSYNIYNSTRWLEDGSYIRLRSVNLGYNLPRKVLSRLGWQQMRVYLQGDNLFLLTKYSGLDPEVNDNLDPKFMGDDNLILPQLRTLNVGVNITF
jgi:TonB-linked SusC/RagA family outer membrane protein